MAEEKNEEQKDSSLNISLDQKNKEENTSTEAKEEDQEKSSSEEIESQKDSKIPEIKPGMTIRVNQKIKEINPKGEEKERIQYFEGLVIAKKHNQETGATITVRKVSSGIGVEKIFPLNLPTIDSIEVKKKAKINRAKLYFLKRGYKKKLKEQKVSK